MTLIFSKVNMEPSFKIVETLILVIGVPVNEFVQWISVNTKFFKKNGLRTGTTRRHQVCWILEDLD